MSNTNEVSCAIDAETDLIIRGASETDVTFMHDDVGAFNVTQAIAWAKANTEVASVHLDVPDALSILVQRDLDCRRLGELWIRHGQGDLTIFAEPLLYVEWNDGTHLLIDGAHRLMLMCYIESIQFYDALVIPFEQHRQFLVRYFYRRAGRETEVPAKTMLQFEVGVYSSPGRTPERRGPSMPAFRQRRAE